MSILSRIVFHSIEQTFGSKKPVLIKDDERIISFGCDYDPNALTVFGNITLGWKLFCDDDEISWSCIKYVDVSSVNDYYDTTCVYSCVRYYFINEKWVISY